MTPGVSPVDDMVQTPGERLLVWASESGEGRWDRLRRTVDEVEIGLPSNARLGATAMARSLAESAHLELDWKARRWSVAPPALATIPGLPHGALLVGGRTGALYRRLHPLWSGETNLDVYVELRDPPKGRPIAVRPTYVLGRSRRDIASVGDFLELPLIDQPTRTMAADLPTLQTHLNQARLAAVPPESTVRTFDPDRVTWVDGPLRRDMRPALRRHAPAMGAKRILLHTSEGTKEVDLSFGIYAVLASASRNVLSWQPADIHGVLQVPKSAPLPTQHARVARLCSGLEPDESPGKAGPASKYFNVPEEVAQGIAESLQQPLSRDLRP